MEKHTVQYPDGNVLLRNLSRRYSMISHGKGVFLYDSTGKEYLDAVAGAFVASVGHGHAHVVERVRSQLSKVGYVNGTQFTHESAEILASKLAALGSQLGLSRCSFLSSGSEAVEAAIKFARQLCVERGQPERAKLLVRVPSYHENTLFALSASGRPHYKKFFGPLLSDVVTVSAPYAYRFARGNYESDGTAFYLQELEETIQREGADSIFAFIVEPIMGSSGGGSVPPPGYFKALQGVCEKYGILIIADEVLCGSGRTGTFFASEQVGLRPDILVLGKGINGGYAPLSVVLVSDALLKEMHEGSGGFMHAQTFMQAPCMTAAGLGVLEVFEKESLVAQAQERGAYLHQSLRESILPLPGVGHVGGCGLLAGVELVADKENKTPFPRAEKKTEGFVQRALDKGLTLWPNVGHVDGTNGDLLMLGPPLSISRSEIDELIRRLRVTLSP